MGAEPRTYSISEAARQLGLSAEWLREDEGNACLRLGEVLTKLGREDEAREAYGAGIGQAEKFGHRGMAEDLRLAQVQLGG